MVAYLLAQRLLFSELTICLGICPTFLGDAPKPIDAALSLVTLLPSKNIISKHLIADSLWSARVHLDIFQLRQIPFTVSTKSDCNYLPPGLIELASDDLPTGSALTYTNGALVLQVCASDSGITSVISGAWNCQSSVAPVVRTRGAYETAQWLFSKESKESLMKLFDLDAKWEHKTKEQIVKEITGWDVLRPADAQGSIEAINYEDACKLKRGSLLAIHQGRFYLQRPARQKSKKSLLDDLYPKEAREAGQSVAKSKVEKRKHEVVDLGALKEEASSNVLTRFQTNMHHVCDPYTLGSR